MKKTNEFRKFHPSINQSQYIIDYRGGLTMDDFFSFDNFDRMASAFFIRNNQVHPNQCFHNSLLIQEKYKHLALTYVEGYAVLKVCGSPIEHGWLEYHGRIIDVTLPNRVLKYFPVDKLTLQEVKELGISPEYVPVRFPSRPRDDAFTDHIEQVMEAADIFASDVKRLNIQKPICFLRAVQLRLPLDFTV